MNFQGFSTENTYISKNISTTSENIFSAIKLPLAERLSSLGLNSNSKDILPVYFVAMQGSPAEDLLVDYQNSLCTLRNELMSSAKFLIYIQNHMAAPTINELSFFDAVSRGFAITTVSDFISLININGDEIRTAEARKVFAEIIEPYKKHTSDELFNLGAKIITWLNRCVCSKEYARRCTRDIPVIIYYGSLNAEEVLFFHFMSRIGIDIICINTQKDSLQALNTGNLDGRMQIFEFPYETERFPYPDKIVKAKLATVAYSAERDLNEFMYSNTSIFKDFQFSEMQSLTLKTTYEEIDILWHQAAKYRAGFNVVAGKRVVVPNIFAKISGVKYGDIDEYWNDVRGKLSPLTRIIYKAPAYDRYNSHMLKIYSQFYTGHNIDIPLLKKSKYNTYSYLADHLQDMLFEKMQEAVNSGLLMLDESELVPLIIYVGLNIDKEILKILQKFDFTKDIPKIIVIDVIEDTFSKVECIQLLLFNLMGFDIIIYTPTGYKNLETYISENAYELYNMNEFKYNVRVPRFKIPSSFPKPDDGGFFNKLFKKGRK